jgi:DNA-binding response OmpR family regulator
MCRALRVLCVAPDRDRLSAVKRAAVSADWELSPGATDERAALEQLEAERPHVVVVVDGLGVFDGFVRETRRRHPFLRIVADRQLPEASVVVTNLGDLRAAIEGLPRPAGPIS